MANNVKENIETIFEKLEKFIKTETVIGEPIVVGEVTLVPIISAMFGCGAGGGTGTDDKSNGEGSGVGLGARIVPDGVLVIKNGEVSMIPVKEKSNLDSLLNMVPEIVSKINIKKDKDNIEIEKDDE